MDIVLRVIYTKDDETASVEMYSKIKCKVLKDNEDLNLTY